MRNPTSTPHTDDTTLTDEEARRFDSEVREVGERVVGPAACSVRRSQTQLRWSIAAVLPDERD